jgi:RHS repeat-associated protein
MLSSARFGLGWSVALWFACCAFNPLLAQDAVSDSVGASMGEFKVDEMGSANYSIPLYGVPGTAGVQPNMALVYSSSAGNGPVGKGFNISGQSAITRCRATFESGDFIGALASANGEYEHPLEFTNNDKFCLDGERLLQVSAGNYGDAGVEYRLELDPFTRVISQGGNNSSLASSYTGPSFFQVFRKDGSASAYGNSADSKIERNNCGGVTGIACSVMTWAVSYTQDSVGNYMTYEYTELNSPGVEFVLKRVNYTGKTQLPGQTGGNKLPYAAITFSYLTKPVDQWQIGYQSGVKVAQTQWLSRIESSGPDDLGITRLARVYRLDPATTADSGSGVRRLGAITECSGDEASCYKPTYFSWSTAANSLTTTTQATTLPNFTGMTNSKLGDVDGDGRLDMVWLKALSSTRFQVMVSFADRQEISGQSVFSFTAGYRSNSIPGTGETDLVVTGLGASPSANLTLLDIDGDGRDDLLLNSPSNFTPGLRVYRAIGRPSTLSGTVFDTTSQSPSIGLDVGRLGDMTGDGIPDSLVISTQQGVALGADSVVRPFELQNGALVYGDPYIVDMQFAPTDFCAAQNPSAGKFCTLNVTAITDNRFLQDFDGDGRADYLAEIVHYDDVVLADIAKGRKNFVLTAEEQAEITRRGVQPIETHWYLLVPTVRKIAAGGARSLVLSQKWRSQSVGLSYDNRTQLADMNGDGLVDMVQQRNTGAVSTNVYINNGIGFNETPISGGTIAAVDRQFVDLVDVTGDGRADVVYPFAAASNRGFGFISVSPDESTLSTAQVVPGGAAIACTTACTENDLKLRQRFFADVDGDGNLDYVSVFPSSANSVYTARSSIRYQPRDVITAIINGYGAVTAISYQPLTNTAVYLRDHNSRKDANAADANIDTFGRGSPVIDLLAPMYVVNKVTSDAPTYGNPNAFNRMRYFYAGAKLQGGGRGFLGFRDVLAVDDNDHVSDGFVITDSRYLQEFPYIGRPDYTSKSINKTAFSIPTQNGSDMNACFENTEAAGQNCFYTPPPSATPSLATLPTQAGAVLVSSADSAYACEDSGDHSSCPDVFGPVIGDCYTDATLTKDVFASSGLRAAQIAQNAINPSSPQQPIFGFMSGNIDASYDAKDGALASAVLTAMCYTDGYGNNTKARVSTYDNGSFTTELNRKQTDSSYSNNAGTWRLGRLTNSSVQHARPNPNNPSVLLFETRTANFAYDTSSTASGLLKSEQSQAGNADQNLDLRSQHFYDVYGNITLTIQCSRDVPNADCDDITDVSKVQQQPSREGRSLTWVQRYSKTVFDSRLPLAQQRGRFADKSLAPYFDGTTSGNSAIELAASTVLSRDVFGNVSSAQSINGAKSQSVYGALGRAYSGWVETVPGSVLGNTSGGVTSISTYRWCAGRGTGSNEVSCPSDAVFRQKTTTTGGPSGYSYFDVLGRAILKVSESFNDPNDSLVAPNIGLVSTKQFVAACNYYDGHNRNLRASEPFFLSVAPQLGEPYFVDSFSTAYAPCTTSAAFWTLATYDLLGRTIATAHPDGGQTTMQFGREISVSTSPLQSKTQVLRSGTSDVLSKIEQRNAMGELVRSIDSNNFATDFIYNNVGLLSSVQRDAGRGLITSAFNYDQLGRKIASVDPDTGSSSNVYNALGELVQSIDAKGQIVTNQYDALGRVYKRIAVGSGGGDVLLQNGFEDGSVASGGNGYEDRFVFDTSANGVGALRQEQRFALGSSAASFTRTYAYDALGRASTRQTSFDAAVYNESTTYDGLGRVSAAQDATGESVVNSYSQRGFLYQLRDQTSSDILYQAIEQDARGNVWRERRGNTNNMITSRAYEASSGRLLVIQSGVAGSIQDLRYEYDKLDNLRAREDVRFYSAASGGGVREEFSYDALNRMTSASLTKLNGLATSVVTMNLQFDALGNICSKNGNGYAYAGKAGCGLAGLSGSGSSSAASPHATAGAFGNSYLFDVNGNNILRSGNGQASDHKIVYDVFDQAVELALGSASSPSSKTTFAYGSDQSRYKRQDVDAGVTQTTRYIGSVEIILKAASCERKRYIGGFVIRTQKYSDAGCFNLASLEQRYVFGDHQGSLDVLTDQNGTVQERLAFDPHGNRRSALAWNSLLPSYSASNTTHGYTGHEHIDNLGVIHMNARLYDPQLGRFLQADPVIQDMTSAQSQNAYSYVLNNPLSMTDPSGASWISSNWRTVLSIAISIWLPGSGFFTALGVTSSFAISVATGFISGVVSGGGLKGGLWGAFSAGLFNGVGSYFDAAKWAHVSGDIAKSLTSGGVAAKVLAHGVAGGVMSSLQGGKFGSGFASAAVTQAAATKIDGIDVSHPSFSPSRIIAAAIVGGTTSVIVGDKFGNGALTGAFSRVFGDEITGRRTVGSIDDTASGDKKSCLASVPDKIEIGEWGFDLRDDAAKAFGSKYYKESVGDRVEYQTAIIKLRGKYGYIVPGAGTPDCTLVDPRPLFGAILKAGYVVYAWSHTHWDGQLNFSGTDMYFVFNGRPNGVLYLTNSIGQSSRLDYAYLQRAAAGNRGLNAIPMLIDSAKEHGIKGAILK